MAHHHDLQSIHTIHVSMSLFAIEFRSDFCFVDDGHDEHFVSEFAFSPSAHHLSVRPHAHIHTRTMTFDFRQCSFAIPPDLLRPTLIFFYTYLPLPTLLSNSLQICASVVLVMCPSGCVRASTHTHIRTGHECTRSDFLCDRCLLSITHTRTHREFDRSMQTHTYKHTEVSLFDLLPSLGSVRVKEGHR